MKYTSRYLLFLNFFWLFLGWQCISPVWQRADLARRQNDLPQAAAELESYLLSHPQDARAYYQLGEIYAIQNRWVQMQEAFHQAESIDGRWKRETDAARQYYFVQNMHSGDTALQEEHAAAARQHFQSALLILPRRPAALQKLAEASLAEGDTSAAVTHFQQVLQLDAQHSGSLHRLMMIYFERGDYQEALQKAQTLQQRFPGETTILRFIAYCLDLLNDRTAEKAYVELISTTHNPQDVQAFAAFLYGNGEYDRAIEESRRAIEYGGDTIQNLRAIAQAYLMQQNFTELIVTANGILNITPGDLDALQLLQMAHAATGDRQQLRLITEKIEQLRDKQ